MNSLELRSELKRLHDDSYRWSIQCCLQDRTLALDVLQTAYLKVLEGTARFDGESTFKTWMFSVIRNTARDELRRRSLRRLVSFSRDHEGRDSPEQELLQDETAAQLRTSIAQLPRRQQEILLLVFYHDMTISEAAGVLRISVGTARTHYERGKQRLRNLLSDNVNDSTSR